MYLDSQFFNEVTSEMRFIREKVFIEEQGFQDEFDEIDNEAWHIIVYCDGIGIATGRVFKKYLSKDTYIIGRLAVLKEYRKLHMGTKVLKLLEDKALEIGAKKIELSAQYQAKDFYSKNAYIPVGDIYLDEGFQHILMEKIL